MKRILFCHPDRVHTVERESLLLAIEERVEPPTVRSDTFMPRDEVYLLTDVPLMPVGYSFSLAGGWRGPNKMSDETERPEDTVRRFARRLDDVHSLHTEKVKTVDGYTLRWCRECDQDYPCPTIKAAMGWEVSG